MTRYVLYSEDAGVFLGEFLGFGFWSNWDPVGQTEAITFPSAKDAEDVITFLQSQIKCACRYATIEECVAAGLPAWDA